MPVAGMLLDQGIFDPSFKKSLHHPQNVALTNSKCGHSISIECLALSDGATHGGQNSGSGEISGWLVHVDFWPIIIELWPIPYNILAKSSVPAPLMTLIDWPLHLKMILWDSDTTQGTGCTSTRVNGSPAGVLWLFLLFSWLGMHGDVVNVQRLLQSWWSWNNWLKQILHWLKMLGIPGSHSKSSFMSCKAALNPTLTLSRPWNFFFMNEDSHKSIALNIKP
jgi:hypothetical protein